MSDDGRPERRGASEEALGVLLAPPRTTARRRSSAASRASRVIGSPAYELDEDGPARARRPVVRPRATTRPVSARQLLAIIASGDRTARLPELRVPALVIHGSADPLVRPDGGRATAAAIPGAELLEFDGMGHDLPRACGRPSPTGSSRLPKERDERARTVQPRRQGRAGHRRVLRSRRRRSPPAWPRPARTSRSARGGRTACRRPAREVEAQGRRCVATPADVSDPAHCERSSRRR